jgi:hypothetical protein
MYSITPCNIVTTKTITSYKIDRIEISLFKSAIITVVLLDSAGSILDVKFINMTGEDYSKWDADDNYVVEFINNSLGFSSLSVVETPVVETPVVDTPVVETPVVETPVVETPVVETPVVETPVVETPVVETPVVETPVVETPVVETPVVETPVVEEPVP